MNKDVGKTVKRETRKKVIIGKLERELEELAGY
jgi:hypothetical protein